MTTIEEYFKELEDGTLSAYKIALKARSKGYDPDIKPEVVIAKNLAERVIGLISVAAPQLKDSGAIARIVDLEEEFGVLDWRVAFQISLEISQQKFCEFKDPREAMEVGIRTGFAYVTLGAVSAPLEGFTSLELKDRRDGKGKYFCLNFAGPVRAAGGTAAAVCVLIADYVRVKSGFATYDPDEKEIKRCHTEIIDYHEWVTNLQYVPSREEMDFMLSKMPVEISGDPSEKYEVSNIHVKDLPRIPTNKIRSGYCLMYSGVLPLKAPKVWAKLSKWADKFEMTHWIFLEEFLKIQKASKSRETSGAKKDDSKKDVAKIKPDYTYIADLVAGRPVFGYPLRSGGFRLRYGRSRTSGFSAQSIHPATMILLNDFIAIGTQLKVERPGKAGAFTSCDTINGPIARLKNGSVMRIETEEDAKKYKSEVVEVLYLGDTLINYGDFFDRAHPLAPSGYVEEEWILEFEKSVARIFGTIDYEKIAELVDIDPPKLKLLFKKPLTTKISFDAAHQISRRFSIPLHPDHIFFWNSITAEQTKDLLMWISVNAKIIDDGENFIVAIEGNKFKRELELIGLTHSFASGTIIIEQEFAKAFLGNFNVRNETELKALFEEVNSLSNLPFKEQFTALDMINSISKVRIMDKCGTFIGSRMGRPEKAKMRKLASSPHTLFPVGVEGGKFRSFQSAMQKGFIRAQFTPFYCNTCKKEAVFSVCEFCDNLTQKKVYCKNTDTLINIDEIENGCPICKDKVDAKGALCAPAPYKMMTYKIKESLPNILKKLNTTIYPDLVKGVKGTSNKEHTAEHLMKGLLRAKNGIYVNKDGTVRYDCSEIPITHFKPKEIFVSPEKLVSLGYEKDINGKPLVSEEQILEIKPQDILLPCSPMSPEEPADEVMFRTAHFVDELFEKLYGIKPYYNLKTKEDLVGHLVIGLAPHTSAGIVCRIIGFTKTQGFLSHPYIHAAMRRDCDGDESCFLLLMDGLVNFSKKYLPESRGSTMDAPLVLTYILNPTEVDDMIFNMDIVWKYNLDFYEAARNYKMPWDVKVKQVSAVLRTPLQYEKMGFTHDTTDLNMGVLCSAYKTLPSMEDKLKSQMDLAEKIRAVDATAVAQLVIDKHFLKDTKGNLRKFGQQEFRCVECNEKYRRPPLVGKCTACNGKLIFTVSEGFVIKYLELSANLAEKYDVSSYLKQTIELLRQRVEAVFGKDKERQEGLSAFMG